MILSINELIDIAIMTAALGYIFSDVFGRFKRHGHDDYDPLLMHKPGFDWQSLWFAAMVTAPAIILHELGHKFMALGFGATATFHAAYMWLGIGILLKLMNVGFIFFVPAYVSHSAVTALQSSMIAFAGPAINLALWLICAGLLRTKLLKRKYVAIAFLTGRINMFLFIFNMLPIPGFDGYWVFDGLMKTFL